MGKIMKSYNKSEDKEIKKRAGELMDSWMKLVPTAGSGKKKKANDDGLTKKDQLVPKKASSKSVHLGKTTATYAVRTPPIFGFFHRIFETDAICCTPTTHFKAHYT